MKISVLVFLLFAAVVMAQRGEGGGGRGGHDGGRGRGGRGRDSHSHSGERGRGRPGRPDRRFPFPFPRQNDVCHSCVRQPLFISQTANPSPCVFQPGQQLSCTSCCQAVSVQQGWGAWYRGAFLMQSGNQWMCSCCHDTFQCRG